MRLLTTIIALMGFTSAAHAGASFTETFDTTVHLGENFALWDTVAGELKLAPRQMTNYTDLPLAGWAEKIELRGNEAFVAGGSAGLHIVDISDSFSPGVITTYALTPVTALDVHGNLVATGSNNTFAILDVTNLTPVALYLQLSYGNVGDIELVGNRAYLAMNDSLRILDISNPASPQWLGSVPLSGDGYGMAVQGDYVYCARGSNLSIVDISDPTNPTVAATDVSGSSFVDVAVDGDWAYASIVDTGVRCFYVGDPSNPQAMATYSPGHLIESLELSGNTLLVAGRSDGVIHLDVADPPNMVEISRLSTPGAQTEAIASAYAWSFVADGDRMSIVQTADGVISGAATYLTPEPLNAVDVQGTYAYLAHGAGGLTILSHAPASDLQFVANVPLADALDVVVEGDYAYVANGSDSFVILDISDPSNPPVVLWSPAGPFTSYYEVLVEGHILYVLVSSFGSTSLETYDVTNPSSPALLDTYAGSSFDGLCVDGGIATLGASTELLVLDVSDPSNITLLASPLTSNTITATDIEGQVVYAVGGTSIQSYDISAPGSPVQLDHELASSVVYDIDVTGNLGWLGTDQALWEVMSVDQPSNLLVVLNVLGGPTKAVLARGDQMYLSTNAGLVIWKTMSRRFESWNAYANSVNINPLPNAVLAMRATYTSTKPGASVELSSDGVVYTPADSATWIYPAGMGSDVRWQIRLDASVPESNPIVDDITVEILYESGHIASIGDVGNDQGRNVRLTWARSGYDHVGSANPIVEYDIYRQQVPGLAQLASARPAGTLAPQLAGWDYVTTVPARWDEEYSAIVPTLADSTDVSGIVYSTFMVRAVATGMHYDSSPDSGYSVDNLAPMIPAGALANYGTGSGNQLSWDPPLDEDFQYFRIYRDTDPNFTPTPGNLVDATTSNGWTDPSYDTGGVFYKLSAVDFAGNESEFAAPNGPTVGIADSGLPTTLQFYPSAPNPFRSSTTLRFALPVDSRVELSIYDITGRRVRSLASRSFEAGMHTIHWNGRDDAGRTLPPGLYLTRFNANGVMKTRRVVRVE